jgi:hypothetical protein
MLLPGGGESALPSPFDSPGDAPQPPLPGEALRPSPPEDPPPGGPPATDADVLPAVVPTTPAPPATERRGFFKLRPTLCLAALAGACALTRPGLPALHSALDAHHEVWGGLLDPSLREAEVRVLDGGIGCVALHSELVWLGLLGRWLPLLPTNADAIGAWAESVDAPQLLLLTLTAGYVVRKLLPRSFGASHLSVSCDGVLRKGRLHTLLLSALSPVGLVHWAHALCVLLVAAPGVQEALGGRMALLGLYAAAGAASALACVLSQLVLGRRAQPRSAVSGGALGVLLLRAAALPSQPLDVGGYTLKPTRAVLLHVLLDATSNALPTPPTPLGVEKLLALAGAAALVAAYQPSLRESFVGALGGWREWQFADVLEYIREAL